MKRLRHLRRTLALVSLVIWSACAARTPKIIIDQADRTAYVSTRAFQTAEEAAWHAKAPWPTAEQHQQIGAKLSGLYQAIIDVANIGIALPPGTNLSAADLAALSQLTQLVTDLTTLVTTATPTIQADWTQAKADIGSLTTRVRARAK